MTPLKRWNSGVESNGWAGSTPSFYSDIFGFRFPRPVVLRREHLWLDIRNLAGELIERETLPHYLPHDHSESLGVGPLAFIEAKRLFVQVPEQVKGLNAHNTCLSVRA
jgi:hypothetical protein